MKNNESSFRHRVLSGFAWLSAGTFVGQLVTWLSTIYVIRLLSPSDYGLMAMAGSFMALMAMMNDLGFSAAIIQKNVIEDEELHQIFTVVFLTGLFAFILSWLVTPIVAWFYGEGRLQPLIRFMSLNFILSALFMVPQSLLVREMNFRDKARVDIISRVISSVLTLVLAILSFGVWALAIGEVCSYAVRAVGFNIARAGYLKPVMGLKGATRNLKFGLSITADRFLYFLFSQSDIVIAGKFLGKDPLGIYAIALNLASIPSEKVLPLITQVSFTAYSRIQEDIERIKRNLLKTVRAVGFFAFPLFFGMAAAAPEGISLILGPKWESLIVPFQLLCLVIPVKALSYLLPPAIFAIGKPMINVVNMAISCVIMGVGFLVGVNFGILGLCMVWILIFPIVFLITTMRSLKGITLPFKDFAAEIVFPFTAGTSMLLSLLMLRASEVMSLSPLSSLLIYVITGAAIYSILVVAFRASAFQEFKVMLKG